ncbi:biotin transporter BioY [Candidatus Woesearchaeota archaeon]|nr:biotin transporter BioY [Candidatus Woesearchaeota archaeon]
MKTKAMMYVALFAALTAAVSPIRIPLGFTPVPITLQTLIVLLSGMVLGRNLGALSQIVYVIVGLIGLPVFSGGSSGFGVLFGPTGGFLFGFIAAAYVAGYLAERKRSFLTLLISGAGGTITLYVFGIIGGMLTTELALPAILVGWVVPFIISDIIKLTVAAMIAFKFDTRKYLKL